MDKATIQKHQKNVCFENGNDLTAKSLLADIGGPFFPPLSSFVKMILCVSPLCLTRNLEGGRGCFLRVLVVSFELTFFPASQNILNDR